MLNLPGPLPSNEGDPSISSNSPAPVIATVRNAAVFVPLTVKAMPAGRPNDQLPAKLRAACSSATVKIDPAVVKVLSKEGLAPFKRRMNDAPDPSLITPAPSVTEVPGLTPTLPLK